MSGSSDDEISNADRHGYQRGGSDGDDDDDDDEDYSSIGKKQRGRRVGSGFAKDNMGKAKQVVLHQFTKAKKKFCRVRSRRALLQSSSSVNANANANTTGTRIRTRSGNGCIFCFSRPKVLESSIDSPASDPNDPNFTHAMLRTLIEKNNFYSKECNPHLD